MQIEFVIAEREFVAAKLATEETQQEGNQIADSLCGDNSIWYRIDAIGAAWLSMLYCMRRRKKSASVMVDGTMGIDEAIGRAPVMY